MNMFLYSQRLLALAADMSKMGELSPPRGRGRIHSKICGSQIQVDVQLVEGQLVDFPLKERPLQEQVISHFAYSLEACILTQASAAILAQCVLNVTRAEIEAAAQQVQAMLAGTQPAPVGRWADFALLESVRDYPLRHTSVLLPFQATLAALKDWEEQNRPPLDFRFNRKAPKEEGHRRMFP